jgi:outer membrane protein OmpA-like peptidoglycan-associated protein
MKTIAIIALSFAQFAAASQNVKMKTHKFYFDSGVHNKLSGHHEISFTEQDDEWLAGRIKTLEVVGHADCRGNEIANMELSRNRAFFIVKNIYDLGVVDKDFEVTYTAQGEGLCEEDGGLKDWESRRVDVIMYYEVQSSNVIQDEAIDEIQRSGKVELVGVNFQPGMRYFLPGVEEVLNAFAESLKKSPEIKIELQGHICCHGKQGDGQDIETGLDNLSVMRAKEVYDFLIAKGIDKGRLRYKGMGNAFPKVWPEMSNADQIANRRVEAVLWE